MDAEAAFTSPSPLENHERSIKPRCKCMRNRKICIFVGAVAVTIILIAVLVVILAFTVFKAKSPVTTVNSVSLNGLDASADIARLSVYLNMSLDVDVSINNPNKASFKYTNSTAVLSYMGNVVGEAPIPAGEISADQTIRMNLNLTVMADRVIAKSQLYSDVLSGTLPLNTYSKVSGIVVIFGFIEIDAVSTTSCDFVVNISNGTVGDHQCNYHTKLN